MKQIKQYKSIHDLQVKLALEEISKADRKLDFYHGAILFKDNYIISTGHNHFCLPIDIERAEGIIGTSKVKNLRWGGICTMHAEIDCLSKVNFEPKFVRGSDLLVIGFSRAGNVLNSKPCKNCQHILYFTRIKRIFYSEKSGNITQLTGWK